MTHKIVTVEDIQALRLDETIKEELYDLKDSADKADAIKHLLNSDGWQEIKEALLEDAQTAILEVILYWKAGETKKLDMAIAKMEQVITFYNTVEGSGRDAKEAELLLSQRIKEIVTGMG